jgi:hypothetical protein
MEKKILVIEDRRMFASEMRLLLGCACTRCGISFESFFVEDMSSAIDLLVRNQFQLVSTGATLPPDVGQTPRTGAGLSLLKHLDLSGFTGDVVFFSASPYDVAIARRMSVTGKPVNVFRKAYGRKRTRKEGSATVYTWAEACARILMANK